MENTEKSGKGRKSVEDMTPEEKERFIASSLAWNTTKKGVPGLLVLTDSGGVDKAATIKNFTRKLDDFTKLGLHKRKATANDLEEPVDEKTLKDIKKYAVPAFESWSKSHPSAKGIKMGVLVDFCFARMHPDLLDDSDKRQEIRRGLQQLGFVKIEADARGQFFEVTYRPEEPESGKGKTGK